MARPSDREFALRRKIKDLEEELDRKDDEIKQLKKKLDKTSDPEVRYKKKTLHELKDTGCPDCGAEIKESELPFGKLRLCSKACGFRETKK